MYLVQILLPLYDNDGIPLAREEIDSVRRALTKRFGGVTAYSRTPAQGTWRDEDGKVHHDDVVVVEVMTAEIERAWWAEYRKSLCARFRQTEIVVRAMPIESL
jgi:hypothetical protein